MLGGLFVILITAALAILIAENLKRRFPFIDASFLKNLFFYHLALSFVYFLYVTFNPSDSRDYYYRALLANDWFSLYGTSTTFIRYIAFPFIQYLNFSYEACMALFAFFGYIGFVYAYVFFKESLKFNHTIWGIDAVKLIFFLPNLHFWSGSLGKGSMIMLGIGIFFFGINRINARWIYIFIGGVIIYHVRPHILLIVLVSSVIGFVFSSKGLSPAIRIVFLLFATGAFFFIYKDVLTQVGIDEEQFVSQGLDLTRRAKELTKATSGIDISNYSLPEQVFTFLYRPLFFDAPGLLGIVVSIENVFYLFISLKMVNINGLKFLFTGGFIVKTSFLSFIMVSIALAQIAGNLGLAIRQKSQVMILFMFVILMFMDEQKKTIWKRSQQSRVSFKKMVKPIVSK